MATVFIIIIIIMNIDLIVRYFCGKSNKTEIPTNPKQKSKIKIFTKIAQNYNKKKMKTGI